MKRYVATENDTDIRLSRFVKRVAYRLPDSVMYKGFRNKRIKVNGKRQTPDYRIAAGDIIELYLNDEFFAEAATTHPAAMLNAQPPYTLVYEDDQLAILYKPAGVLSHHDMGGKASLLDAYTHSLILQGTYNPAAENVFAPALFSRLDRGTEGLIPVAKTARALRDANEIVRLGLLHKTYRCIALGTPPEGVHKAYLTRQRDQKTVTVTATPTALDAKKILTGVHILQRKKGLSLCEIDLLTGRTHQIRAHLAFLGAPLLGDVKYGRPTPQTLPPRKNQALCAYRLAFDADLPQNSALAHLASQTFTVKSCEIETYWQKL